MSLAQQHGEGAPSDFVTVVAGVGAQPIPYAPRGPIVRFKTRPLYRHPALAPSAPELHLVPTSAVAYPVDVDALPTHLERRAYEYAKRAFDILFAVSLLILFAPLFLAIATVIRATSPGPALYRQTRCGRGGTPFTCFKFRSMIAHADQLQTDLTDLNELSGPVFKMRCDPRVTPVGHWLRKLSFDELPQLWNVLRGDMSLVGPRPPLPSEVALYDPHQMHRLDVTPGLTCLWQVSGRSNITFDRWVELDLEYIRRRSFAFDLWLIVLTIPAVITGRGAF